MYDAFFFLAGILILSRSTTSATASWQSCGTVENYQLECARITVPRDHFGVDNGTFSLFLNRLVVPGAVKTILFNPGGPGFSGTRGLITTAAILLNSTGSRFNLLGFDPRGVNQSTPSLTCHSSILDEAFYDTFTTLTWDQLSNVGNVFASEILYKRQCKDLSGEDGHYVNTVQASADLLWILDAIGQNELYLYGVSWGTLLAQTFIQLYPDRVGRIVMDGLVEAGSRYGLTEYIGIEKILGTDRALQFFVAECVDAKANCEFNRLGFSPQALTERILQLMRSVHESPIPIYDSFSHNGLLNYKLVASNLLWSGLYTPDQWWLTAQLLYDLIAHKESAVFSFLVPPSVDMNFTKLQGPAETQPFVFYEYNDAALPQKIAATFRYDTPGGRANITKKLMHYVNVSRTFGVFAAAQVARQLSWPYSRAHNFTPSDSIYTKLPLLMINNLYDPATPYLSAQRTQKRFVNSALVGLNTSGHAALSVPSQKLNDIVQDYFLYGHLPQNGIIVEPSKRPFDNSPPYRWNGTAFQRIPLGTEHNRFGKETNLVHMHEEYAPAMSLWLHDY